MYVFGNFIIHFGHSVGHKQENIRSDSLPVKPSEQNYLALKGLFSDIFKCQRMTMISKCTE